MNSFLLLLVSLSASLATPAKSVFGNPKSVFDATIYGYPFVVMAQKMHEQVGKVGGFNKIFVSPSLSNPQESQIPSPNGDTLYIYSWIDLRNGPVVFNTPNITDRFYIFEFMDFTTLEIISCCELLSLESILLGTLPKTHCTLCNTLIAGFDRFLARTVTCLI